MLLRFSTPLIYSPVILLFIALVLGQTASTNRAEAADKAANAKRPNILVVVVDDMGFSDPGCFGGEVQTPNIDQLAKNGVRMTQFYNCSRCCQTRASLLTGAYPKNVGMQEFGKTMDINVPTLAENLRDGGYSTGLVGKWHLSELPHTDSQEERILWMNHELKLDRPFAEIASYPTRRGFEQFYGIVWGVVNHYDPFSLTDGETPIEDVPTGYHATDAISERSVDYLKGYASAEDDKPFFLYIAYTAPHWPIQAHQKDIEKYKNRYAEGWDTLKQERFARQQEMGLFDEGVLLGENSHQGPSWDNVPKKNKKYLADKMAVHAAMIDHIDQGVGNIIEQLRTSGELDNTIIFFFSDNGASPEIPQGPGYDRYSGTRDGRAALRDHALRNPKNRSKLGTDESYTGIGAAWASAANTPLRFWKAESYEGGCRTPMVIHWPDGLKAQNGSFVRNVRHVIDIAPTCYELAGVTPKQGTLKDGESFAPMIAGKPQDLDRALYFHHGDGAAIRRGSWKASKKAGKVWELFNVESDPAETTDLSQDHPEVLESLVESWQAWREGRSDLNVAQGKGSSIPMELTLAN